MRIPLLAACAAALTPLAPLDSQVPATPGTPLAAAIDSATRRIFALNAAPGVGIVVVRDTQIVYAGGLGFADLEARRPATAATEFYIASTTKAFTGSAVAILDGQESIRLDAPISRYLPGIPLRPPLYGDSITVRSLLAHTHGIGAGPVAIRLAYTGEYTGNAELVRLLAEHVPNPRGREYAYTNLGYNIVGLAMDTVLGESWKETLRRLIFSPLGMTRTSAYVSGRAPEGMATGYVTTPDGFARAPYGKTDATMQSAGGLYTTALDMGRWLEANITGGRLDGRQILPAAAVAEAHRIQAPMSGSARGTQSVGYGLGWRIALLEGDTLLSHNGGFIGFASHMSFMPRHRVGVAVMANDGQLGAALTDLIAYAIYDVLRGRPAIAEDSLSVLRQRIGQSRAGIAADRERRAARPQTLPFPIEAYAGRYSNPAMGHLELTVVNGKLEARMGAARSGVEVYDHARNQLRLELFGGGTIVPVEMEGGRAASLTMSGSVYRRVR